MKKKLSLILAAIMILSLLGGCGSEAASSTSAADSSESSEASVAEATNTEEAAAAEESASEAAEESQDEEAAPADSADESEIIATTLVDDDGMMNPTEMGVEYIYPAENGTTVSIFNSLHTNLNDITDYSQYPWMSYVQEETGFTLDWTTVEQSVLSDRLNIMLASGDYTDMIMNFSDASYTLASAYEEEIIVNLTDYMEEYSPNYYALLHAEGNEDFLLDCCDDDGNFLCYWMLQNTAITTESYWVRTDMLETAGITEIPTTFDGWEEAMLAVLNCGSYELKTGLLVNSESFSQYFSYGYDIPGTRTGNGLYRIDDTVYSCYTEDAFREYLTMMTRWYEEGLLYSDFVSMDSNPMSSEITGMITQDQAIIYSAWNNSADGYKSQATNPDFAVAGIAEPMLTEGQTNHFGNASRVNNMHNLVITASADVEACMTFCDWWYTGEGISFYNYGEEGVAWNWNEDETERVYTELVTNDPDGYAAETAWSRYNLYGNFIGYSNEWRSNWIYSEDELAAMEIWNQNDSAYSLPTSFMSLTTEETSELSTPQSDIDTYVSEHLSKMVMGEEDITDDAVWNNFVDTINSLGMQTIVDIYQAAYDRYLNRS